MIYSQSLEIEKILEKGSGLYTFVNPVSYLIARDCKDVFENFDGLFVDGGILVRFIHIFNKKRISRRSFDMTSLAPVVFNFAEKNHKKIFLIGSTSNAIGNAAHQLTKKYPRISIVGFRNGYINSLEEEKLVFKEILDAEVDIVIVGMGAPKQEKFLSDFKNKGYSGLGFTCGGFLHQISTQQTDYYPNWVDKLNVRFIYRFLKEKHTRTRYINAAFKFPYHYLVDSVKYVYSLKKQ